MSNGKQLFVVLALLCAGCGSQKPAPTTAATEAQGSESRGGEPSDDIESIAATFRDLELMTSHARLSGVSTLCGVWTVDYVQGTQGPHSDGLIKVYMNDLAKKSYGESTRPYPEGAVIVKEKLNYVITSDNDEDPSLEMTGLGGMIKRHEGYDPEHGDWEYFYADGETNLQRGRIGTCVDCHDNASDRDYVFGKWDLGD